MTITVIESKDKELLEKFEASADFQNEFGGHNPKIEHGRNDDAELDDTGRTGTLHRLLIEDTRSEDHVTFRLDETGLHFWATGVEV